MSGPMTDAVNAAMFLCPLEDGKAVLTPVECEQMVRAAIATYLHEKAVKMGRKAGLTFCDPDA